MKLPVRFFANDWFCVTKKKSHKDLFLALSKCGGENEKYKLFIPDGYDTKMKHPNEKPFFNGLFDLKSDRNVSSNDEPGSRRDNFQRYSANQEKKSISQLFDVKNNCRSSQETTPTSSTLNIARSTGTVYNSEENNGNTSRPNIFKLFDHFGNSTQDSNKSPSTNKLSNELGIGEHNLLKKERIIISTNNNLHPPENCSKNIKSDESNNGRLSTTLNIKQDKSRVPSYRSNAESKSNAPEQKTNSSQQSLKTRKESIYDHGDDVWLDDDIEGQREVLIHKTSSHRQETLPRTTPTATQQRKTEHKDDTSYRQHGDRVRDSNCSKPSQNINFGPKQKSDDGYVSLGGHIENKSTYNQQFSMLKRKDKISPCGNQRSEGPPNKVAKLYNIDNSFKQPNTFNQSPRSKEILSQVKSYNVMTVEDEDCREAVQKHSYQNKQTLRDYDDHTNLVGYNSKTENENTYGHQPSNYRRTDQIYTHDYQRPEEPSNKIANVYGSDAQFNNSKAQNYNTESFGQLPRSLGESSRINRFETRQYSRRTESGLRNETVAMSEDPDTRFANNDKGDFTKQNKIIFDYESGSCKEYKPMTIIDYSQTNKGVIDYQNSNRQEQEPLSSSGYGQSSSSWNRSDDSSLFSYQRPSAQVSKLFDMADSSIKSTSQPNSRFSREYRDSFNSGDSSVSMYNRATGSGQGLGNTPAQYGRQSNERQMNPLWKDNIKQMFDQRRS